MSYIKNKTIEILRWSEAYTKTNMLYLVKNSFWVNAQSVLTSAFVFILSILFARFVSKDTYGTYQFLISLSSILGGTTLMGMNNAVTQAVARGFEGTLQSSVKEQLRFLYIPLFFGALISGYYFLFNNVTLSVSFIIIAILLPLSNAFNTWSAYISGKKDFKSLFFYNQIFNVFYYGGLIVVLFLFPYTIPLVIATFLLQTCANIFIYLRILKKNPPNTALDSEAITYGKKLSLSNILPLIALHIDNLIIFHFLGPIQLAIYAFASNIPERLGNLLRPISIIAFPKIANKNINELPETLRLKTAQLFILAVCGGVCYFILAPFLFTIFLPNYLSSVVYSQAYTLVTILAITTSLPLTALFATRSNYIFKLNIYHPVYSIILICVGAYMYGIWGVIGAKILSGILLFIQTYTYSQKKEVSIEGYK